MAKTGHPGGRQSLENTRHHGDIHAKPPSSDNAKSKSIIANASVRKGSPNTNRHVG